MSSLNLRLDLRSSTPIYAQIVDGIRHRVAIGALRPGQQLPTVRDLAATLHVNVNTVARAYDLLDTAGVISTQQGRGTYIADRPDDSGLPLHRRDTLQAIVNRALLEALSLGYNLAEIEDTFAQQLKQWQRAHRSR